MSTYYLTRILLLRVTAFVFATAFLVALHQNTALIGNHGLTPAAAYLSRVRAHYSADEKAPRHARGAALLPPIDDLRRELNRFCGMVFPGPDDDRNNAAAARKGAFCQMVVDVPLMQLSAWVTDRLLPTVMPAVKELWNLILVEAPRALNAVSHAMMVTSRDWIAPMLNDVWEGMVGRRAAGAVVGQSQKPLLHTAGGRVRTYYPFNNATGRPSVVTAAGRESTARNSPNCLLSYDLLWTGGRSCTETAAATSALFAPSGEDGTTTPTIIRIPESPSWEAFKAAPTLLWWVPRHRIDAMLQIFAATGVLISVLIMLTGRANALSFFVLWVLYHSIVAVGQQWYSFGWESQVLETAVLMIFSGPWLFDGGCGRCWIGRRLPQLGRCFQRRTVVVALAVVDHPPPLGPNGDGETKMTTTSQRPADTRSSKLLTALQTRNRLSVSDSGTDDADEDGELESELPFTTRWLFRFLLFRIMLGAGLIKLRGDSCWRDLTCMEYHYETQPVPNPLTVIFFSFPKWVHKWEVLVNHFVEMVAPFGLMIPFAPASWTFVAGGIQLMFQVLIILSGNLSFLNWLTLLPALVCFHDQWLLRVPCMVELLAGWNVDDWARSVVAKLRGRPQPLVGRAERLKRLIAAAAGPVRGRNGVFRSPPSGCPSSPVDAPLRTPARSKSALAVTRGFTFLTAMLMRLARATVAALVLYLSAPILDNLLSPRQVMNTSYDWLRLVNTYGAFGSITKERNEVIVEGRVHPKSPLMQQWEAEEEEEEEEQRRKEGMAPSSRGSDKSGHERPKRGGMARQRDYRLSGYRDPKDGAVWLTYEFQCKPGSLSRRPCWISPYHYRLDWLMWFVAFQGYQHNPWLLHLAYRMLENDEWLLSQLIAYNPFSVAGDGQRWGQRAEDGGGGGHLYRPTHIRMSLQRYKIALPSCSMDDHAASRTASQVRDTSSSSVFLEPCRLDAIRTFACSFPAFAALFSDESRVPTPWRCATARRENRTGTSDFWMATGAPKELLPPVTVSELRPHVQRIIQYPD